MWGLWNSIGDSHTQHESDAKDIPGSNLSDASTPTPSHGALLGEIHEPMRPLTEEDKKFFTEYTEGLQKCIGKLLNVVDDFLLAHKNPNKFEARGSIFCNDTTYVDLGTMGDSLCSRFDYGSQGTTLPSTYVSLCNFGTQIKPRQLFDFLINIENKTLYDNGCSESTVLYRCSKIVFGRQCYKGMMGVQGREFLLIGANYKLSEDCYVIVAYSPRNLESLPSKFHDIPVVETYVRAHADLVGYFIRCNQGSTELFFVNQMDLGGMVPLMLQRIIFSSQLQMISTLKKFILDNLDIYYSGDKDEETP
ncbi:hypothetical protein ACR3K2_18960 [Cryptosporidium serpentis]